MQQSTDKIIRELDMYDFEVVKIDAHDVVEELLKSKPELEMTNEEWKDFIYFATTDLQRLNCDVVRCHQEWMAQNCGRRSM